MNMTTQEDFMLFNQYNAQVNAITNQKNQLKYVMEDFNKALEEVKKPKEMKSIKI
jgi:chaperonin cofactor prefoldin